MPYLFLFQFLGWYTRNMIPVLLNLPFLKLYTFGVFLVLAFFWGSFLLWKNIRLTSYKEDDIFDGVFVSLAGGLFVGRLVYVALNFNDFGFNFLKFVLINGYPGLSLYGALLGGLLFLLLFLRARKIDFLSVIDSWVSPILIAIGVGKLGSFFSGVEVGTATKFPLSLKYPGLDGSRHLTSLYEAIFFLVGAVIAQKILSEIRRDRFRHGFSLIFFAWFFSLDYFLFDKLKNNRLYLAGTSFNEIVGGVLVLILSLYFLYHFRVKFLKAGEVIKKLITRNGIHTGSTSKTEKNS